MRRAFTILELMLVIAIIAVLSTLVISAASSSLKSTRAQRRDALFAMIKSGMDNYRARYGKWPGPVGTKIASGSIRGNNGDNNYVFTAEEVRSTVKALCDEVRKGNPVIDVTELLVSRQTPHDTYEQGGVPCMDFMTAIRGSRRDSRKMKTAEMYFGYPIVRSGKMRRFKITYAIETDAMAVTYMFWEDTNSE